MSSTPEYATTGAVVSATQSAPDRVGDAQRAKVNRQRDAYRAAMAARAKPPEAAHPDDESEHRDKPTMGGRRTAGAPYVSEAVTKTQDEATP